MVAGILLKKTTTMVKVEIVEEKDNKGSSPYIYPQNDTSSPSSSSDDVSSNNSDQDNVDSDSFIDRLVDFIPPTTRRSIQSNYHKVSTILGYTGRIAGSIIWVVTTSALLIGLPLALSLEDEARIVQQEKDMIAQQQGVQQMVSGYPQPSNSALPGQQQKSGLVPPGF